METFSLIHTLSFSHTHTSYGLVAAGGGVRCRRRVAQGSAEVLVHHGADVSLEVGEEDAAGAQVLSARRQLLVLLFFDWRVGGRAKTATATVATSILAVLHLGVQGQFLVVGRREEEATVLYVNN